MNVWIGAAIGVIIGLGIVMVITELLDRWLD